MAVCVSAVSVEELGGELVRLWHDLPHTDAEKQSAQKDLLEKGDFSALVASIASDFSALFTLTDVPGMCVGFVEGGLFVVGCSLID